MSFKAVLTQLIKVLLEEFKTKEFKMNPKVFGSKMNYLFEIDDQQLTEFDNLQIVSSAKFRTQDFLRVWLT